MKKDSADNSPPLNESAARPGHRFSSLRSRAAIAFVIFLLALGVRVLTWHDTWLEVRKVQTVVVDDYQRIAVMIRDGGLSSLVSRSSPLADLNTLGHPPGYSFLIALIFSIKQSDAALQLVQMGADALSVVFLFFIVSELVSFGAGVCAGLLAALSPQLAWNSVLLLPDSISVLPILIATYLLVRAAKNPRLLTFIAVGALIGLSCWLRANAMLLTLFIAAATLLMFTRQRWQFALAVICGALLVVLPLTIRNAIVFHRFIPLSLGAGQTFLEGIADYDKERRLGIPDTDMGIMKQEAELYQRPDYYSTLFNPDGVERERARLSRGFAVVRSHPLWFAGVMTKRASSMLRLERSRLVSTQPSISHGPESISQPYPVYQPPELARDRIADLTHANLQIDFEDEALTIIGDDSKYGIQAAWPLETKPGTDYLLRSSARVENGRIRISVLKRNQVATSTVVDMLEGTKANEQPFTTFSLAFVSDGPLQLVVNNEAPNSASKLTAVKLYELGPSRFLWTRYPRIVLHAIQRVFLTAVMLPLASAGLLVLIFRKQRGPLVILSIVPVYFFLVQSAVHTEYRYVIAVTYFMFAFAGIAIGCGVQFILHQLRVLRSHA